MVLNKLAHPRVSIIAAIGTNRELGRANDLIWRISADLKRVKALTMGHPIIMGRKTYESIGRPLPGRTNIVVTSSRTPIPGCVVVSTIDDALAHAQALDHDEVFIFGGASLYTATLPLAHRLYLTLIHDTAPDADVFFPPYDAFSVVCEREEHLDHTPPYTHLTLERP